jgi:hypothetical protein
MAADAHSTHNKPKPNGQPEDKKQNKPPANTQAHMLD